MDTAAAISNDFQAFRLWNLTDSGPRTAGEPAPRGPYMVVQDGCAPGDPTSRLCSFVLTRRGTWLHGFLFFMLPERVRREIGAFDSVREVFALVEGLVGKPRVETAKTVPELLGSVGYQLAGREPLDWLERVSPRDAP